MAEKINQPLAPANRHPRSDEESDTLQSKELRRKKRVKLAVYIAAFSVFQTVVILVFALTVMRVRTPKVRLGTVTFKNMTTGNLTSPFFDISFTTQVRVRNTNFGPYKYDSTNVTFTYQGVIVGRASIPKGKAGFRSTKKVSVMVYVNSNVLSSIPSLGSDLNAGVLTLNSHAKLRGKVELIFVLKKEELTEMNCTMNINISTEELRDLNCK
ncbi:hypothetical protein FH972_024975 [Carpinus fangiana]|uniref:Late embryogenesis abundant protein LEA-2 subgroup domain-containing protein n=1 Tax=Carpinus fangiana TaxID=176857 RepID=A0A5N6KZP2_9ROSI|nr:hypothetical protein FH972_024975 [Carpinus fangiana]